jgi:hypothetical protein
MSIRILPVGIFAFFVAVSLTPGQAFAATPADSGNFC